MNLFYRHQFEASDIWNLHDSGLTTVQVPGKVISVKGKKQVGSTASQERGELTTIVCAINASGGSIPPFFIFKRKNMKDTFLINTPPQSAVFVSLYVCVCVCVNHSMTIPFKLANHLTELSSEW